MKRYTISLPDELYELLREAARHRGVSLSQVVREAVEANLAPRHRKVPGFVGLVSKQLPYTAADVDAELAKTFGRD